MGKVTQIYPKTRFPFSKVIGEAEAKSAYYRTVCIVDIDPPFSGKLIAPIGLHLIYRLVLFIRYSFLTKSQDRYWLIDIKRNHLRKESRSKKTMFATKEEMEQLKNGFLPSKIFRQEEQNDLSKLLKKK
jgi:hypothetical protein